MTYDDLLESRNWAEREVSELREEYLELYGPEKSWDDELVQTMNDAENEVHYLQERLDTGDYEE